MANPTCPKCGNALRPYSKTPTGATRWGCRKGDGEGRYCYSTTRPEAAMPRDRKGQTSGRAPVFKRALRDSAKVFIITAAQNGTPIHKAFWTCLLTAAKHRRGEVLVIPIRYKNPTSRWSASQANEEWWADEVTPYLWNVRRSLNENLVLLGDVKTQPTASSPLTGFDAISGGSSAILGHTKMQLRCVPAPSNRMAKVLTTTGACTVANYTDSKAGKLGQFHHSLAAIIVEVVGRQFHLRQLHYDARTQSVTDLATRYRGEVVEQAPRPLALVTGDTHVDSIAPQVERATFGPGGMVETLRPHHIIWHDLLDGYSVNPHHAGNPFISAAKAASGAGDVEAEVKRACKYVKAHTPTDTLSVVVPSNHDDFLRRWIISHDWKADPLNAKFYLRTALKMLEGVSKDGSGAHYPSPFPMVFPDIVDTSNIKLLRGNESFALAGVELGMHGDRGPNGARGSITNHRRLGVRSIIGHSHTPGIDEGAYQVGTSTLLRLEYNGGPSSWLNAHAVLHADGKRQLIFVIDGRWRA